MLVDLELQRQLHLQFPALAFQLFQHLAAASVLALGTPQALLEHLAAAAMASALLAAQELLVKETTADQAQAAVVAVAAVLALLAAMLAAMLVAMVALAFNHQSLALPHIMQVAAAALVGLLPVQAVLAAAQMQPQLA